MTARPRQYQAEPVRARYRVDKETIYVGEPQPEKVWTRLHIALFVVAVIAAVLVFFGPLWMGGF